MQVMSYGTIETFRRYKGGWHLETLRSCSYRAPIIAMNSPSYFPPQVSRKTLVPFVIAGSTEALGFRWRDRIPIYIDHMIKRLGEDNYPHPPVSLRSLFNHWIHPQAARDCASWPRQKSSRIQPRLTPSTQTA
jgi:hypothetical protein